MNVEKQIMLEEDLFPKMITNFVEVDYGILFFNEENKTSYDSNHAVIFKERINDLDQVLKDVIAFYQAKGIHPSIYQATADRDYFMDSDVVFKQNGFNVWLEDDASFMLLTDKNTIKLNDSIVVKEVMEWDSRIETDICIPAKETHEIEVFRSIVKHNKAKLFVGYKGEEAVAVMSMHTSELDVTRFDYILVAPKHRKKGYARELLSHVVNFCHQNGLQNCYQWPAHQTSERLCYEAGFRRLLTAQTARASYIK